MADPFGPQLHICRQFSTCRMSLPQDSAMASAALGSMEIPSSLPTWTARRPMMVLMGRRNLRSRQYPANVLIFCDWRSLQMHTMGTLLALIILTSSAMPARSPAPIPSTSSMMMQRRLAGAGRPFFPPIARTWLPVTSPRDSRRPFCERQSLAFQAVTERPEASATRVAVVVFPMPGGPERRAPRWRESPRPCRKFFSQEASHDVSFFTQSPFPRMSWTPLGAYLSAHSALASDTLARPPPMEDAAAVFFAGLAFLPPP
mmetsp:Transcript_23443/g.53505  ORF Transcript_23443/g.53505 Transcript_23443/m.53505 type:complete len:259 (+) Transcript_23443:1114-1890(+)